MFGAEIFVCVCVCMCVCVCVCVCVCLRGLAAKLLKEFPLHWYYLLSLDIVEADILHAQIVT